MSFLRCVLADFRLKYVPKLNTPYRYELSGPFDFGEVAIPRQIMDGYVQYDIAHRNGQVSQVACPIGTFASMFMEITLSMLPKPPIAGFVPSENQSPGSQVGPDGLVNLLMTSYADPETDNPESEDFHSARDIVKACQESGISMLDCNRLLLALRTQSP